jgi:hypothetical protein
MQPGSAERMGAHQGDLKIQGLGSRVYGLGVRG